MTGQFTSQDGHKYTVIIRPAISGTLTMAADPVHIAWESSDGNPYQPVRSVSATIRVQTATSLAQLYTADPLGCPVVILRDGQPIFDGFLTPQEWQSPMDNGYNEVEMVAVDALTALKTVNYTMRGTSAQLLKPSQLIAAAIAKMNTAIHVGSTAAGVIYLADTLPWDGQYINEQAFLPDDWDESVYDEDRTPWTDVFTALGTYLGGTFMMEGNKLRFIKVDDIASTTRVDVGTHLTGASMEMVPAKSAIEVEYTTEHINLVPEMEEDRVDDEALDYTTFLDDDYDTFAYHLNSHDWEPTDDREGCAVYLSKECRTHYEKPEDPVYAIAGPAILNVKRCGKWARVKWTIDVWGRDDVEPDGKGYPILTVYSEKRNIDIDELGIELRIGDTVRYMTAGKPDTETSKIAGFSTFSHTWVNGIQVDGDVSIFVPAGVVIKDLVLEAQEYVDTTRRTPIYIKEKEKFITPISEDYNDVLTINASLRNTTIANYYYNDVLGGFDAYPYVTPAQFEAPRPRYQLTLPSIPSMSLLQAYSLKKHDSSHLYLPDGADFDLRMNQATLSLLQTWQEY